MERKKIYCVDFFYKIKLISKALEKDSSGYITLLPEELEDMWHVYNLIAKKDLIKATTIR
jgi:protein pelota